MRVWVGITGLARDRIALLRYPEGSNAATHPFCQPLWPLLGQLAAIRNADRYWLKSSDPRNHPGGYISEALQRLILRFILDHRNEEFVQRKVRSCLRRPETISEN